MSAEYITRDEAIHAYKEAHAQGENPVRWLEAIEEADDLISIAELERYCDILTKSTNPAHYKANEKFIEYMDDEKISSFGNWQFANGFNTALVAIRCKIKGLTEDVT